MRMRPQMEGYTFSILTSIADIFIYIFQLVGLRSNPEQKINKDSSGFNPGTYSAADPDHSWFFEEFLTFQLSVQI